MFESKEEFSEKFSRYLEEIHAPKLEIGIFSVRPGLHVSPLSHREYARYHGVAIISFEDDSGIVFEKGQEVAWSEYFSTLAVCETQVPGLAVGGKRYFAAGYKKEGHPIGIWEYVLDEQSVGVLYSKTGRIMSARTGDWELTRDELDHVNERVFGLLPTRKICPHDDKSNADSKQNIRE